MALPPMLAGAFASFGLPAPSLPPMPGSAPAPGYYPPQPSTDGWPLNWTSYEDQVAWLTNDVRARGTVCGNQPMPPVPPLAFHPSLRAAARGHSRDMALRGYDGHISPEGWDPGHRMKAAGYPSDTMGENVGGGHKTPRALIDGQLSSPAHCMNLMDPRYRYLGVGYFFESSSKYGTYFTLNFGG